MAAESGDSTRRHVFISHHFRDDTEVDKLTNLLSRKGHDIRNSSIRLKDANKPKWEKMAKERRDKILSRLLRMKISWSGAVVVLIGDQTHSREWVNWEIEEAQKQGKRIVGVWAHGGQESDMPENLKMYADAVVGWQSDRIVDAIDGKINNWEKPDGTEWPKRDIVRVKCQ